MEYAERYARNGSTLSETDQACLAASRVLLVGLGGLGGAVLEQLLRLGVGHITGADGDTFTHSNLNRQLLATESTLGQDKALAAAARAAEVNPLVHFQPISHFLSPPDFKALAAQHDVVIDALGGLHLRRALQQAASAAHKPLVSAGIAGLTGWVAVVRPHERGPVELFGNAQESSSPESPSPESSSPESSTVEERLGNLVPVAMLAASLQVCETVKLLIGRPALSGMLVFDLEDLSFYPVQL